MPLTRIPDPGRILQRYPAAYRPDTAQLPQSAAGGFSGAAVWKIESPAGACALRATQTQDVDLRRVAELHRLIVHIRAAGFEQIPVPIATSAGETYFTSHEYLWQLEPWMPGAADYSCHPSRARLGAAMTCLARWHVAASRFVARPSGSTWFFTAPSHTSPGLAGRLEQIKRWDAATCGSIRNRLDALAWPDFAVLGREILDRFQRLAAPIAACVRLGLSIVVPLQPCLRDVWHDHVLFTGDEVTGLIDPHAARSDCVSTDLARLLGSLAGNDRRTWDAGLAAYQRVRPLSLDELALLELFDQSSVLLSGMTWLDWCCLQGRSFTDRERVIARLSAIVDRLRVLKS